MGRREGARSEKQRSLEWLQAVAREGVREVASRGDGMWEEVKCSVGDLHVKRGGTGRVGEEEEEEFI